jgi:hypothetical protein
VERVLLRIGALLNVEGGALDVGVRPGTRGEGSMLLTIITRLSDFPFLRKKGDLLFQAGLPDGNFSN